MYRIINIITECARKLIQLINFNNKNKIITEEKKANKAERNRYGFPIR